MDNWFVIAESVSRLQEYHIFLLQLCKDLGIVITIEKSDLELTNKAQYLTVPIDTVRDRVNPTDSWITSFQIVANIFFHLTSLLVKM